MYARIENNNIVEYGTPSRRPIEYGGRGWDCRDPEVRAQYMAAAGWIEIVEVARPADTATHTTTLSHILVGGIPTQVWTSRLWTTQELATRQAAASKAALTDVATLDARLDRLAAYKTDPEIVAALARANTTTITTQELNRLFKVMLRREERLTATLALLVRLIDPALLADITDTTDN